MRQADFLDDRAGRLKGRDRLADAPFHPQLHAGDEVLPGQAQPLAPEGARGCVVRGGEGQQRLGDGHRRGGRIALVAAGYGVEQGGGVAAVPGKWTDLVE